MTAPTQKTADQYWQFINEKTRGSPEWQMRVAAHVRAKTGHMNPASYHHNGAGEEEKRAFYMVIAKAILTNDPSLLEGEVARGQAVTVPPVQAPGLEPTAAFEHKPEPVAPEEPEPELWIGDDNGISGIEVKMSPEDEPEPDPYEPDAIRKLREALEAIGVKSRPAEVDQAAIEKSIEAKFGEIRAKVVEASKECASKMLEDVQKKFDEAVAKLPPRANIEIITPTEKREVNGIFHRQFPQAMAWVEAGVPLWLWSKSGPGKTHLFYQIAEALGIKPWVLSCDETLTVSKLLGYRAAGNGEFIEGLLYHPFKDGGLLAMDEVDLCSPAIACTNAFIANGHFLFPNGETVTKHPSFRIISGANTKGTGATCGYVARNRLDAASLDRWAIIEMEYDEGMELEIACGIPSKAEMWKRGKPASPELCERYVRWVQSVRKEAGNSVLISPRASYSGVKALRAGIPPAEVAAALVFKLVTDDTKARLIQTAGEVPSE